MAPKLMKTREPTSEVKRIMVALVAAATSGSTFISSISGPCSKTDTIIPWAISNWSGDRAGAPGPATGVLDEVDRQGLRLPYTRGICSLQAWSACGLRAATPLAGQASPWQARMRLKLEQSMRGRFGAAAALSTMLGPHSLKKIHTLLGNGKCQAFSSGHIMIRHITICRWRHHECLP